MHQAIEASWTISCFFVYFVWSDEKQQPFVVVASVGNSHHRVRLFSQWDFKQSRFCYVHCHYFLHCMCFSTFLTRV